jgi:hypothetical protein
MHVDASSNHDVASPRPRCTIEFPNGVIVSSLGAMRAYGLPDLLCTMSPALVTWPLSVDGLLLRLISRLLPLIAGSLRLIARLPRVNARLRCLNGWSHRAGGLPDPPIAVRGAATS